MLQEKNALYLNKYGIFCQPASALYSFSSKLKVVYYKMGVELFMGLAIALLVSGVGFFRESFC